MSTELSCILEGCLNCAKCVEHCAFLKRYGTPKAIAEAYDPTDIRRLTLPFQCHLCGLCTAVCPVALSPVDLFLEMRREAVDRFEAPLGAHGRILAYEARGISKRFTGEAIPMGCRAVFFPGCAFSGSRMDTTIALFDYLRAISPEMGLVLDCCCKPSHDLGRTEFFNFNFGRLRDRLLEKGVTTVYTACPSCHQVFCAFGGPLAAVSVYELLAADGLSRLSRPKAVWRRAVSRVCLHDPCATRNDPSIQAAVRALVETLGIVVEEMPHSRKMTLCCGEGGAAGFVAPELATRWGELRRMEAAGRRLFTYCAGCAEFLNPILPTDHLLDAIFHPEAVVSGKRRGTKSPWTYFNRLRLKRYLRNRFPGAGTAPALPGRTKSSY